VQHFLEMQAFFVIQSRLLWVVAVQWCAGYAENLPKHLLSLLFSGLLALLYIAGSLLEESLAEAALHLLEVARRLGNAGLSVVACHVLLLKEASWCERLLADHAVARLEAGLRNVEVTSSLLLVLRGSLVLLGEDKARLLEEHVG